MSPEERAAIRARCEAATAGDDVWGLARSVRATLGGVPHTDMPEQLVALLDAIERSCTCWTTNGNIGCPSHENCGDVPTLLAEVERLEAEAKMAVHERCRDIEALEKVGDLAKTFAVERDAALADAARLRAALKTASRALEFVHCAEDIHDRTRNVGCRLCQHLRDAEGALSTAFATPAGDDALREFGLRVAVAVHENEGDGTIAGSLPELVDAVLRGER